MKNGRGGPLIFFREKSIERGWGKPAGYIMGIVNVSNVPLISFLKNVIWFLNCIKNAKRMQTGGNTANW